MRRVWDPIWAHLHKKGRVLLVPDDALNLVNPPTLPAGPSAYLVEVGPQFHYLSA